MAELKKALGPVMLWGLGVGYVISGEYFGWNLGLPAGGSYGLLFAFGVVTVLYVAFVFSYAELACAIPRAGGAFVYGGRALGPWGGSLAGTAQAVEFILATAAIAMAIGEYANLWVSGLDKRLVAAASYLVFTAINIWGVKQAAVFELVVTILAVGELLLFSAVVAPHFSWERFSRNAWPNGWPGALAAIPLAIWFYLAIEGVANAAEEARNPQRDVALGFGSAMLTLVVLASLVLFLAVGVGGWEAVVYDDPALPGKTSDAPLPLALKQVVRSDDFLYDLLVGVGLIGLVASFHGIILAGGRAVFEMGRVGFLPRWIGSANRVTRTPASALLLNAAVGIGALLCLETGDMITLSALAAAMLYVLSMLSLFRLRATEPDLPRPYRTPLYPWLPIIALLLAALAFCVMAYQNVAMTVWYLGFNLAALLYFFLFAGGRPGEEAFRRVD